MGATPAPPVHHAPMALLPQNDNRPERSETIERHIQTVLITVITAALLFAANYFYSDNSSKAVQKTQLEVLTQQVIEMRADLRSLQNNYVKREDWKELELRVRETERRIGTAAGR